MNPITTPARFESSTLIAIENCVCNFAHLHHTQQPDQVRQQLLCLAQQFLNIHDHRLCYSPAIAQFKYFIDCIYNNLNGDGFDVYVLHRLDLNWVAQLFNMSFINFAATHKRTEQLNRASLQQYLHDLITAHSRLMVVRVDLALKQDSDYGIVQFQEILKVLLKRIADRDGIYKHLLGHAWALEQGEGKGYHCHLLLIYNGAQVQSDYFYAQETINLWGVLTNQQGYGFNCHTTDYKAQFAAMGTLGIGRIERNNPVQVQNMINTASYLVNPEKNHQHLRACLANSRSFGRGTFK